MIRKSALVSLLFISSCGHKAQTRLLPPVPAGPPDYAVAYQDGLSAFREATPDGYQRAVASFRKASTLQPSNCDYSFHLSESLFFQAQKQQSNWEDWQAALLEANTILTAKQDDPACAELTSYAHRLHALNLSFVSSNQVKAVAEIDRAIELDRKDPMNWVVLAQIASQPGLSDPLAPIQHAVELAPDLPVVQYELGNYWLMNAGAYVKARQAFERAVEFSPRHFEAVLGAGYAMWLSGDDATSDLIEPQLQKAVAMAPTYLKGRSYLGDYYAGLEETEKAVEQYQAAVNENPRFYPAYLSMGTALLTAERNAEAEKAFLSVIALDLRSPHPPRNMTDYTADCQAHSYLGDIWLERSDLVKAKTEYDLALRDIITYVPAMYGLGVIFHREDRDDEALVQFDKVIKTNSRDFPNAYLSRAGIRAARRDFSGALSDLNQAITIYQRQVLVLKASADADESKGRKRRANGERRRQALIETTLQKAIETKKAVEILAGRDQSGAVRLR